ncbi:MAG TPA: hypothetical protein VGE51_12665 [Fontimonas sp.]
MTASLSQAPGSRLLKICAVSLRWAGIGFLALAAVHLAGAALKLPLDSLGYYLAAFCGCLMFGLGRVLGDALVGATAAKLLLSMGMTLLLFAAMRVAFFLFDLPMRELVGPALIGEIVLFGGLGVAMLVLRKRA